MRPFRESRSFEPGVMRGGATGSRSRFGPRGKPVLPRGGSHPGRSSLARVLVMPPQPSLPAVKSRMMDENLFAYGSLMCEDILARVSGLALTGEQGWLSGYARHPVLHETFPGVVCDQVGRVDGILYRGLSPIALQRLDAFEGDFYQRDRVQIDLVGGEHVAAWCYIVRDQYRNLLLPGEWDYQAFLAAGKAPFMTRFLAY